MREKVQPASSEVIYKSAKKDVKSEYLQKMCWLFKGLNELMVAELETIHDLKYGWLRNGKRESDWNKKFKNFTKLMTNRPHTYRSSCFNLMKLKFTLMRGPKKICSTKMNTTNKGTR